jgi:hypothetical protein
MGSRFFAWLRALALVGVVVLMAAASSGALQSIGASLAAQGSSSSYGAQLKRAFTIDVAAADNGDDDNSDSDDDNEDDDNSGDDNSGDDNSGDDNSDDEDNSGDDNSDDEDNSGDDNDSSSDDNEDNSGNDDDTTGDPDIVIDNIAADDGGPGF